MRRIGLFLLLLGSVCLTAESIQIGNGSLLNQHLPIEPFVSYSYSQQLYRAADIGFTGQVSAVSFQYNIPSTYFIGSSAVWKLYLGHTQREQLDAWVPLDSLVLVFDGTLSEDQFSNGIPGQGWLNINLDTVFHFNGSDNLLIAVDENDPDFGSNADDFICTEAAEVRGIVFASNTLNPDPASPPPGPENLFTRLAYPNLRLEITPFSLTPWHPQPEDQATGIPTCTDFRWQSNASSFDVWLGTDPDELQLMAQGIASQQWTPPQPLGLLTSYYWQVVAHADGETYPGPVWSFSTAGEGIGPPQNLSAYHITDHVQLNWQPPLEGEPVMYRVIRNGVFLAATQEIGYQDYEVGPGQVLYYYLLAQNHLGELSDPSNTVTVHIPDIIPNLILQQSFEACSPFSQNIPGWQNLDMDNSPTWSPWPMQGFGEPLAWLVFPPAQLSPPQTGLEAHSGAAMAASFNVQTPPNNDWLITPRLQLGSAPSLNFWARSHTVDYGLERLRVLISTTDADPASFTSLNSGNWLSVPAEWTEYSFDLAAWQGQSVHLAFNCVSWDALALYLDDIVVTGEGGYVPVGEDIAVPDCFKVFPNPARGTFSVETTGKSPFNLALYDLRGRELFSIRNLNSFHSAEHALNLAAGVYFLRLEAEGGSQLKRLAVIK